MSFLLLSPVVFPCFCLLCSRGGAGLAAKPHVPLLGPPWSVAARLLCPRGSPGKNTGVGCHFLLQEIFQTQESNLGLLHCRRIPALQADSLRTEPWGKPHFVLVTVFFAFISLSLFPQSAYASSWNRFDDCSLQISVTWFYHLSRLSIDVYVSLFSHGYWFSWFLVSVIFFTRSWTLGMRESFPR